MIIDAFTHVMPPRYHTALRQATRGPDYLAGLIESVPELADLDARVAVMDRLGIDVQVLTPSSPPVEIAVPDPRRAAEIARLGNDEIAELTSRHGGRFIGVGGVAMSDPEHMVREAERCLDELGLAGMLVYSSAAGKPLDRAGFRDFFALMAERQRPIWMHPARGPQQPDYRDEERSRYWIWQVFGWPYETTVAMTRLVFDGLFDRHPEIVIVTHHAGGMLPAFHSRAELVYANPTFASLPELEAAQEHLQRPAAEYFRRFYADTALWNAAGGLRAALDYFGPERLLFGTDSPFDGQGGALFTRQTLASLEALGMDAPTRAAVLGGNAARLLDGQGLGPAPSLASRRASG